MNKILKKFFGSVLTMAILTSAVTGCMGNNPSDNSTGSSSKPQSGNAHHEVWSTYATRKVVKNPSDNSAYEQLDAKLNVQMMKNETEGAQLIITAGNSDINSYDLQKSELSDGNGHVIPVENISVYHQKYLEIERKHSSNPEIQAGNFVPDMLLPIEKAKEYNENKIAKGNNQGVTVEITTSHDTVPGVYTGTFVLDIDGKKQNIPVTCEVWDIEYEGRRTFQSCFILYRNGLLYGEYDNSPEIVQAYTDFLLDYKINTYVIQDTYPVDEFTADFKRQFENDNYNSIVIPYTFNLSDTADSIVNRVGPYIEAIVSESTEENPYIDYAYFYPSNVDEADMDTGATGGTAAKMRAAYNFFSEGGEIEKALQKILANCESKGLLDGKSSDFAERVKQSILHIPSIFTNVGFVSDAVEKLNTTFCPYLSVFDDQIQAEKYQEQAELRGNDRIWAYTCSGPLYPYPTFHTDDYALGLRVSGWMEKKYDINGYLYWSVAKYAAGSKYCDVYATSARYETVNGDGYIMYPGKYYGSDKPFGSIRLSAHRDSMDDYDMLCVYENLLNSYADKYGVEINFDDYVNDLYDGLFDGAMYYTDDSLVYEIRNRLAQRILALKNDDQLLTVTSTDGNSTKVSVYTTSSTLKVDGTALTGEVSDEGYRYDYTVSTETAKTLALTTVDGSYTLQLSATAKLTNFANGTQGITCTGREGVDSTKSTVAVVDNKLNVNIRSYYAKGEGKGYGPQVEGSGIDGATQRIMPSVTFAVNGLTGANNVYFTIENTGSEKLETYVQLVMDNGIIEEITSAYVPVGKTKDIRAHINESYGIDLSKVIGVRIAFKNVYSDKNGYMSLWNDRTFTLSDLYIDKK